MYLEISEISKNFREFMKSLFHLGITIMSRARGLGIS